MQEWTESELKWYLDRLNKDDTYDLPRALFVITQIGLKSEPVPTGNAKVIRYLEQLVKDHRLCIVNYITPESYGEMRWLAGRVLACEYAYLGIEKPIILKDVIQPIRGSEIARIAQNKPTTLEQLIQRGLVPTATEIIKPQDYAYCCSKEAVEERRRNQDKNK